MPRSSGSERPQRVSPRAPHPLRTSSSDSDHPHHRPIADRSPKVIGNRRSPSSAASQSDPLNQKKLGTRIADLESQLGQAQTELRNLKEQLSSAEAEKKVAQEKLKNKGNKVTKAEDQIDHKTEVQEENGTRDSPDEIPDETQKETDVFEVPVQKVTVDQQLDEEAKPVDISVEPPAISEPEKPSFSDLALKEEEINSLKANLAEKETELESLGRENESLKTRLDQETSNILSVKAKEEETRLKLGQVAEELEASKLNETLLKEKLELLEGAKSELDVEMKKMRVQTEQWRKAADAAAGILAGAVDMNGRIPERCGSMDKHFGGAFEPVFVGSPGMADDFDDGNGSGKHKGSGIRSFWKKKGQK
ncbi:hypothetical protein ACFE04_009463 [Oxalis oulophora]